MLFIVSPPARFFGAVLAILPVILFFGAPRASAEAEAEAHTLRLEGAGAIMVGRQADRFDFGGGLGLSYEYRLVDHLGVEAGYSAFFFPEAEAGQGYGSYQTGGLALRVHPLPHLEIGDLWVSGGGNAVFTGSLVRFGLEAGAGFEFRVGERWKLGPYVRYAHVFQPSSHALGPADAGFIQIGVSIAFSPRRRVESEPEEEIEETEVAQASPDEDTSGDDDAQARVAFAADEAPDADDDARVETVAERELREVSQRILFAHGSAEPLVDSMAALVRVGQIIEENLEWEKITIEGHSSQTGSAEVNQRLSLRRAERMKELLVKGGVDASRIEVVGHGKDRLEVRGDSPGVHARNQRVVFKVHVIRRVPVER